MSIDLQTKCRDRADWTFDYFLAKRFKKSELEEAYKVHIGPTKVREFKGPARSVGTQALHQIGTARRKDMIVYLEKALKIYDDIPDNGDQFFGRYEVYDYFIQTNEFMKRFK